MSSLPPLYGLVLSGGQSTRMGADKGSLVFEGEPQTLRAFKTLAPLCEKVFVSARREQSEWEAYRSFPLILDEHVEMGPMAGVLAAMIMHPGKAWLVLAVDRPFIGEPELKKLLGARTAGKLATAFYVEERDGPDSMCALYEPEIFPFLEQARRQSRFSLRKVLQGLSITLLDADLKDRMADADTPEEFRALSEK